MWQNNEEIKFENTTRAMVPYGSRSWEKLMSARKVAAEAAQNDQAEAASTEVFAKLADNILSICA